jgi:fatty-acid desaturase
VASDALRAHYILIRRSKIANTDVPVGILPAHRLGLHCTWLINSATHIFGSRRFETADDSRNSFVLALLPFGEGWHNNHHAHQTSARHGMLWHELDISWITLKLLKSVGLVWGIRLVKPEALVLEQKAA